MENISHDDFVLADRTDKFQQITESIKQITEPDAEDDYDSYMKKFEDVEKGNIDLTEIMTRLTGKQTSENKINVLACYVRNLQKQNDRLYDLLVEMNNYFGSK
mgnify:FL=1